ncbi:CPBP family intramembrane glutamic endopeptidase [Mycetocola sp.]|uniref:CPBP family intramembrane glutamic endopeptidase n=1 Tax=Mycetocola sp. TaxID=1871042 RepID=UPI00398924F5
MPDSSRARAWWEIAIVLGLSVGASAVYSLVSIVARVTDTTPLAEQSARLNTSQSEREWLDFSYQFLGIFFGLFVVALVVFLLWQGGRSGFARIGLDFRAGGSDAWRGILLFLAIGVPGILLYAVGRAAGLTVAVEASPLETYWWTIPVLILAALRAGLVEEVIVVGYLFTRLRERGWTDWMIILGTSLLRGIYHLYQGVGPFFGNVAMGILFGWCYRRWGRVMPLVVAHTLLDVASFVGYPLAASLWPDLFTAPK